MGIFIIKAIVIIVLLANILSGLAKLLGGFAKGKVETSQIERLITERNIQEYTYFQTENGSYILDDEGNEVIYIIDSNGWVSRGYEYIYDVELIEDNVVVQNKSLVSTAGRAIVGGVVAGGVGAVIGGATAKTNSKRKVYRIELTLSFKTRDIPYKTIVFLDDPNGVDIQSERYLEEKEEALYWSKRIASYINQDS